MLVVDVFLIELRRKGWRKEASWGIELSLPQYRPITGKVRVRTSGAEGQGLRGWAGGSCPHIIGARHLGAEPRQTVGVGAPPY